MKWFIAGVVLWVGGWIALMGVGLDDDVGIVISLALIIGVPAYVAWDMLTD